MTSPDDPARWAADFERDQKRLEREAREATDRREQHQKAADAEACRAQAARLRMGW